MKVALNPETNVFTHSEVKQNFKPFISAKLLKNQSPDVMKQIADIANKNGDIMKERQIVAIQTKVPYTHLYIILHFFFLLIRRDYIISYV